MKKFLILAVLLSVNSIYGTQDLGQGYNLEDIIEEARELQATINNLDNYLNSQEDTISKEEEDDLLTYRREWSERLAQLVLVFDFFTNTPKGSGGWIQELLDAQDRRTVLRKELEQTEPGSAEYADISKKIEELTTFIKRSNAPAAG